MKTTIYQSEHPFSLILASDSRLTSTSYTDDQIWEFLTRAGDPPAISLQTTYGLRARMMRIFPRFSENGQSVNDPNLFAKVPEVIIIYPSYIQVSCEPFLDLDVQMMYWVPESQGCCGKVRFSNHSTVPRKIRFEWIVQLSPNEGQRMAIQEIQAATVLAGKTGHLSPVVFLTGGPRPGSGSYSGLQLDVELLEEASFEITWAEAALSETIASFLLARSLAARKWESEFARLELVNLGNIEIQCENKEWETILSHSQRVSYQLLLSPQEKLPYSSFILSRMPDQGFSMLEYGTDYNHLWSGQTTFDSFYLRNFLLPSYPQIVEGLIRNFLAVQKESGFIDHKPGLGGQRGHILAAPLLCTLALEVFTYTQDLHFLGEIFNGLNNFIRFWISPDNDKDGDGIPEWDHPLQAGYDNHPIFSTWHSSTHVKDITAIESPGLSALLFRECKALKEMAIRLDRSESLGWLDIQIERLKNHVENSWNPETQTYQDRDRDTHASEPQKEIGFRVGPGWIKIHERFKLPARLSFYIHSEDGYNRLPKVSLKYKNKQRRVTTEYLASLKFTWEMGDGAATTQSTYRTIDSIQIENLNPGDQVTIFVVGHDYQDISQFLSIWAGTLSENRAQELIEKTLLDPERFWQPFGIPFCPVTYLTDGHPVNMEMLLPWNAMVAEALIQYGYRNQAMDLFNRWMRSAAISLHHEGTFKQATDSITGQQSGTSNCLASLIPVGVFLEILGVHFINPHRLMLTGLNPFSFPVTLKFRGTTVYCHAWETIVIFPDGQTITVTDGEPRLVTLEMDFVVEENLKK